MTPHLGKHILGIGTVFFADGIMHGKQNKFILKDTYEMKTLVIKEFMIFSLSKKRNKQEIPLGFLNWVLVIMYILGRARRIWASAFTGGFMKPCPGEGNGNPLQYSCVENPMDRGAS